MCRFDASSVTERAEKCQDSRASCCSLAKREGGIIAPNFPVTFGVFMLQFIFEKMVFTGKYASSGDTPCFVRNFEGAPAALNILQVYKMGELAFA